MCRWHCIRCTYCIYCFKKINHLVLVPFAFIFWCKRSRVGNSYISWRDIKRSYEEREHDVFCNKSQDLPINGRVTLLRMGSLGLGVTLGWNLQEWGLHWMESGTKLLRSKPRMELMRARAILSQNCNEATRKTLLLPLSYHGKGMGSFAKIKLFIKTKRNGIRSSQLLSAPKPRVQSSCRLGYVRSGVELGSFGVALSQSLNNFWVELL